MKNEKLSVAERLRMALIEAVREQREVKEKGRDHPRTDKALGNIVYCLTTALKDLGAYEHWD